jgi:hypothetical protein
MKKSLEKRKAQRQKKKKRSSTKYAIKKGNIKHSS